ncbi:hypothetical protein O1M54_42840 [Streptomyces diastatochromogenes]|nr:hypothetical protein [Streptomyces diastatochromogenes]
MTTDHELPAVLGGFDLADQSRFAAGVPYGLFARLRTEAPVLFHPGGRTADGDGFWVLTRHADIVAAAASRTSPPRAAATAPAVAPTWRTCPSVCTPGCCSP